MQSEQLQPYLDRLEAMLLDRANLHRAKAVQADKSTGFDCLAISVPALRRVALYDFMLEGLSREEKLSVYDYIWKNGSHFESLLVPLLYYRKKKVSISLFEFAAVSKWISRVDNWAHCDELSVIYSYCNHKYKDEVFPFLKSLNRSDNLWRRRASIVSLIHYSGKNSVYLATEEAFPLLIPHMSERNKYIANAVGWVLREYKRVYPDATGRFVNRYREQLSPAAIRRMQKKV